MSTMWAVTAEHAGGPDVLRLQEVPRPPLAPGHIRVAVHAAGVNFRDVQQRRGADPGTGFPLISGSDFAGDVTEVGPGVDDRHEGQRVFGISPADGAYAEEVVVPAVTSCPVPGGVGYDQAAAAPVAGLSASFLLALSGLTTGMTAVTLAPAGGLGCFLGGLLSDAGVRSIGITSGARKVKVAKAVGHRDIVDYQAEDPVEAIQARTGGHGADVVFDSVAGPELARSLRMLRTGGTVILCGRAAGPPDLPAVWAELIESRRDLGLRDFFLRNHVLEHLDEVPARLTQLAAGLASGQLRVPIQAFPLKDAARAHELIESRGSVGKLVLTTE